MARAPALGAGGRKETQVRILPPRLPRCSSNGKSAHRCGGILSGSILVTNHKLGLLKLSSNNVLVRVQVQVLMTGLLEGIRLDEETRWKRVRTTNVVLWVRVPHLPLIYGADPAG